MGAVEEFILDAGECTGSGFGALRNCKATKELCERVVKLEAQNAVQAATLLKLETALVEGLENYLTNLGQIGKPEAEEYRIKTIDFLKK